MSQFSQSLQGSPSQIQRGSVERERLLPLIDPYVEALEAHSQGLVERGRRTPEKHQAGMAHIRRLAERLRTMSSASRWAECAGLHVGESILRTQLNNLYWIEVGEQEPPELVDWIYAALKMDRGKP